MSPKPVCLPKLASESVELKSRFSRRPLSVISPKLPVSDEKAGIRSVMLANPGISVLNVFSYEIVVNAVATSRCRLNIASSC